MVPKGRWVVFGWEQIPRGSWGTRTVVKHDGEVPSLAMRGPMEGFHDAGRSELLRHLWSLPGLKSNSEASYLLCCMKTDPPAGGLTLISHANLFIQVPRRQERIATLARSPRVLLLLLPGKLRHPRAAAECLESSWCRGDPSLSGPLWCMRLWASQPRGCSERKCSWLF